MSACRSANVAHQSFNVLLTKYQFTDIWEVGGQATYRSKIYGGTFLAANQGTSLPSYWRFDAFAEAKINKNWKAKLFVNNIFNQLYYDALVPECDAVRIRRAGPHRVIRDAVARVLIGASSRWGCGMLICVPGRAEQG